MSMAMSRRRFAAMLPALALAGGGKALAAPRVDRPTARQVIDRIHAQLRAEGIAILPDERTSDRFIAGDPDRPVTGIATTFMSTFDVLQRARDAGLSLVISHEPTFYHHLDRPQGLDGDRTVERKRQFAEDNGMVVWRFHDHWHMHKPEPISVAFFRKLGIEVDAGLDALVEIPPTRLGDLVTRFERALRTPNIRYWGDPDQVVRRMRWGGHQLANIAGADTDVFIWAEPKEFNVFEYFQDARQLGVPRSIIGATHQLIEEWGMLEPCANWVRDLVPEVPVRGLQSRELYWTI